MYDDTFAPGLEEDEDLRNKLLSPPPPPPPPPQEEIPEPPVPSGLVELPQPAAQPPVPEPPAPEGLIEIPEPPALKDLVEIEPPKGTDPTQWDEEDKKKWQNLAPDQKKAFLEETSEKERFADVLDRRKAIADEEFTPPENWNDLSPAEKTAAQEEFQHTKQVFLKGFDDVESVKGNADVIGQLRGEVQTGTTPFSAVRDEVADHLRAQLVAPLRGFGDIGADLAESASIAEGAARGIDPKDTFLGQLSTATKVQEAEWAGKYGDTFVPEIERMFGGLVGFMAGGEGAVPMMLMGAATGFGKGYNDTFELAHKAGREASVPEALARGVASSVSNTVYAIPFLRSLNRLEKMTGGALSQLIGIGRTGGEFAAGSYAQSTAMDAYDKLTGLSDKDWNDIAGLGKMGQSLQIGAKGLIIGLLNAVLHHGARAAGLTTQAAPAPGEAPPAETEVPPPPGTAPPPGEVPPLAKPPDLVPPAPPPPPVYAPGMQVEHTVDGRVGNVTHVMPDGQVVVDWGKAGETGTQYGLEHPDILKPAITPEAAGAAVVHKVDSDNEKVEGIADDHAEKLQAAGAPKTADAIKAVAEDSNKGASVTAEEFLAQAQRARNQPAMPPIEPAPAEPAPAAAAPAGDARFAPPAEPAAPAVTPGPAPATMGVEPRPAVVVGGQVFTGNTPAEAAMAAHDAVGPDAMSTATHGWVDPATGRFASHDIYNAHQAFNTALDQAGGNTEHPAVQQAGETLAAAQARDTALQAQIVHPGGEQVINPGIKGQEAVVTPGPPPEVAKPLEGVTVTVGDVTSKGQRVQAERPAAEALNEARNDRTALTLLRDCLH